MHDEGKNPFYKETSLIYCSNVSYANEWKQDSTGWQYVRNDGTVVRDGWINTPESGEYYYFDSNGYMQTGIVNMEGKEYYFNDAGVIQTSVLIPCAVFIVKLLHIQLINDLHKALPVQPIKQLNHIYESKFHRILMYYSNKSKREEKYMY